MPGALITVVGFGRVSALSTRLAAALLSDKAPPGRRPAFGIDDLRAKSSSAVSMARAKLVTKHVTKPPRPAAEPSRNAETAHCSTSRSARTLPPRTIQLSRSHRSVTRGRDLRGEGEECHANPGPAAGPTGDWHAGG